MLNSAPGRAAAGLKNFIPKATARPEFCMPTSMANVRHTDGLQRKAYAMP